MKRKEIVCVYVLQYTLERDQSSGGDKDVESGDDDPWKQQLRSTKGKAGITWGRTYP